MADWDAIAKGFRYDIWANRLWLECLDRKRAGDPDRSILGHILSAQQIWVLRVLGESLSELPKIDASAETMLRIHAQWLSVLQEAQEDRVVHYRRTTGEEKKMPLSDIAMHVINHGTYHRGELRGLCLSRNDDDFPETDWGRLYG